MSGHMIQLLLVICKKTMFCIYTTVLRRSMEITRIIKLLSKRPEKHSHTSIGCGLIYTGNRSCGVGFLLMLFFRNGWQRINDNCCEQGCHGSPHDHTKQYGVMPLADILAANLDLLGATRI